MFAKESSEVFFSPAAFDLKSHPSLRSGVSWFANFSGLFTRNLLSLETLLVGKVGEVEVVVVVVAAMAAGGSLCVYF